MKKKHYDLILEWACGAEIEFFSKFLNKWEHSTSPAWNEDCEYRIKPKLKPDIVLYAYSNSCMKDGTHAGLSSAWDLNFYNKNFDKKPNIKLTYDGETTEFKSAEKI